MRNGNGVYTLPSNTWNPAVSNTDIDPTDWNTTGADIATALTGSIAADGQTTITADLPMASHKLTGLSDGSATTDSATYGQVQTALGTLTGFIGGLTLSTAGSSATFGIAVGRAVDSTSASLMTLASAYTKTTSAWALGTAAGGLDTGAIANSTWYHVFLIKRTDSGVVDVLFSLSATAPTMPTGYTLKRRIGSMKTNGSAQWLSFTQFGDRFLWVVSVSELSNTNVASATTKTLAGVPSGVNVKAVLRAGVNDTATQNNVRIASTIQTTFQSGEWVASVASGGTPNQIASGAVDVTTDTSANVLVHLSTYNATNGVWLVSVGWEDARGRV